MKQPNYSPVLPTKLRIQFMDGIFVFVLPLTWFTTSIGIRPPSQAAALYTHGAKRENVFSK